MNPLLNSIIDISSLCVSSMAFIQSVFSPFHQKNSDFNSEFSSFSDQNNENKSVEEKVFALYQRISQKPHWEFIDNSIYQSIDEECSFWQSAHTSIDLIEGEIAPETQKEISNLKNVIHKIITLIINNIFFWNVTSAIKNKQIESLRRALADRQSDFFKVCSEAVNIHQDLSSLHDDTKIINKLREVISAAPYRYEPYVILGDYLAGIRLHREAINCFENSIKTIETNSEFNSQSYDETAVNLLKTKLLLKARLVEQLKLYGQFDRANEEIESVVEYVKKCIRNKELPKNELPACVYQLFIEYHLGRKEFITAHSSLFELFRSVGGATDKLSHRASRCYLDIAHKIESNTYVQLNFWDLARYIANIRLANKKNITPSNDYIDLQKKDSGDEDEKWTIIAALDMIDGFISADRDSLGVIDWILTFGPFQDQTIEIYLAWMLGRLNQLTQTMCQSEKVVNRFKIELCDRTQWSVEDLEIATARYKTEKDRHIGVVPQELCLKGYLSEWKSLIIRSQNFTEGILTELQIKKYQSSFSALLEQIDQLIYQENVIIQELTRTTPSEDTVAAKFEKISSKIFADQEANISDEEEITYNEYVQRGNLFNFIASSFVPVHRQNSVVNFLEENGIELDSLWQSDLMVFVPSNKKCDPEDLQELKQFLIDKQANTLQDLLNILNVA